MNTPHVPEHVIQRIVAEEATRIRVQAELDKQTITNRSKAWQFLNSNLGIFVLTTIFVSGIGSAFTLWQQHAREVEARRQAGLRLLAEFDFRLNEVQFRSSRIAKTDNPTNKGVETMYVWRAARGNSDFQPAVPQFRNVHWAGIIIQLAAQGATEGSAKAIAATRVLENGGTVPVQGGYGVYPPGVLEQEITALQSYSDNAWKVIDPSRPPERRPF